MTKITVDLEDRQVKLLRAITAYIDVPMRSVLQAALDEYIARHGYTPDTRTTEEIIADIGRLTDTYVTAVKATKILQEALEKCKNPNENIT